MATHYNPKIVTSGLVLALDAANTKSFKGEPTTNLVPNPDFSSGTTSWGTYTITPTVVTVTDVPRTYGVARSVLQCVTSSTLNGGGNYGGTAQSGYSLTAGLSYTISYYARSLSGTLSIRFSNQTGSGDESNLSHDITVTSAWTKFTRTVTLDLAKSQTLVYNKNGSIAGATFQIADMQIEQKAYATNFVNGTRGTTVATGGGWADLTTKSNNGELINGPTYSSANSGSIVFDGVDDRIYFNLGTNTNIRCYDSTVIFCVNLPVVSGGQRCILSYRGGTGGSLYIGKSNSAIFSYYNGLSTPDYTIGTITANTPFVCAITLDATNTTLTHYINGVSFGGVARTGWASAYNDTLYLGYDAGGTNEFMIGNFYTFLHYNRVLTAAEIKQNFNAIRGRFGI